MNINKLLKRFGLVSRHEIRQIVEPAKERVGILPASSLFWNADELAKEARNLLRSDSESLAIDKLAKLVTSSPATYILGWAELKQKMEACFTIIRNKIVVQPESQVKLRVDRLHPTLASFLEDMSIAEAAQQMILEIEKRPAFYIVGIAKILANKHLPLVEAICARDVGNDWILNLELVQSRLEKLFDDGESAEGAFKQILSDISQANGNYLKPNRDKAIQLARTVFAQLEPKLRAALPSHVILKGNVVINRIEYLLLEGTSLNNLVQKLLQDIKTAPFEYVSSAPRRHQAVDNAQVCARYR